MKHYYVAVLGISLFSTRVSAASPESIAAALPAYVQSAFAPTSAQLLSLRAQGKPGSELYAPYAQAAATVADYANTHKDERPELLKGLSNALKLSFWNPEYWANKKPLDKRSEQRYKALFADPTPGDGSDRLVGEVFAQTQTSPYEFAPAVRQVVMNTLYTVRSNPGLQGAIISALSIFLKNAYEANDIVSATFNAVPAQNAEQYAKAAEHIIGKEMPKYLPLKRGLMLNALINELLTHPLVIATSTQPTADNLDPFVQQTAAQFANAQTAQEYAAAVKKVIKDIGNVHIPYARYRVIKQLQDILFNSPVITPTPVVQAGQWQPIEQKQERKCKWYEIDCWIMLGIDKLTQKVEEEIINPIKEQIIVPITDKTRELAQKLKGVATTITCLPDKLTYDTRQIIGGTTDECKPYAQVNPADTVCTEIPCDKKICPEGQVCISTRVATMAEGLTAGAQKITTKIQGITTTLATVQQQRDKVTAMNLKQYGLSDLDALEAALMKAFASIENALTGLATLDCSSGALCNIKKALEKAAQQAQQGSLKIQSGIEQLRYDVTSPRDNRQPIVKNILSIADILEGIKL